MHAWPSGLAGAHCWEVVSQYELAQAVALLLQGDPLGRPQTPMVHAVFAHCPSPLQLAPFLSWVVQWPEPQNMPFRQSLDIEHGSPSLPPASQTLVFGLQKLDTHSFEPMHATPVAPCAAQAAVPVLEVRQ
jgi:hypothetical protein